MIKVNNSSTPKVEKDTLLIQLDFGGIPTPLDRLPKGIYYGFNNKWNSIIPLLSSQIKALIESFGYANKADIASQVQTAKTEIQQDYSQTFLLMGA